MYFDKWRLENWKNIFFLKFFFKRKRIYFSLFGSNSIETIKTAIYSKLNKKCNIIGKIKKVLQRADENKNK